MNKLTIIGNLTNNPEVRQTSTGITVCNFTVAVNRKRTADGNQEADYFRVSVWRQLGEVCAKYLTKGKKVCVIGPVTANAYQTRDGNTRASLEVTADDIEFLSPREQNGNVGSVPVQPRAAQQTAMSGMTAVEVDDFPF